MMASATSLHTFQGRRQGQQHGHGRGGGKPETGATIARGARLNPTCQTEGRTYKFTGTGPLGVLGSPMPGCLNDPEKDGAQCASGVLVSPPWLVCLLWQCSRRHSQERSYPCRQMRHTAASSHAVQLGHHGHPHCTRAICRPRDNQAAPHCPWHDGEAR